MSLLGRRLATLALLVLFVVVGRADTEGPNSPTTQGTNSPAWTNPEEMETQNDTNADGDRLDLVNQETLAFSAVSGTVDGVTVEIDWFKDDTDNNCLTVNLLNVGTCTSKNTAVGDTSDTDSYLTLGGAADTWSCTVLTATNVTNAAFGVSILATKCGGGANPGAGTYHVDHVRATVDYTLAGGKRRVMVIGD